MRTKVNLKVREWPSRHSWVTMDGWQHVPIVQRQTEGTTSPGQASAYSWLWTSWPAAAEVRTRSAGMTRPRLVPSVLCLKWDWGENKLFARFCRFYIFRRLGNICGISIWHSKGMFLNFINKLFKLMLYAKKHWGKVWRSGKNLEHDIIRFWCNVRRLEPSKNTSPRSRPSAGLLRRRG